MKKSKVLIEALPYIKKFFNKVLVIKFGGSALSDENTRRSILEDIVFMNYSGMKPVLVHGGGPFINMKMRDAHKKPRFVDGLRVTDKKTMEIVDSALTELNGMLVEEIKKLGAEAFGLSGKENKLITARKVEHEKADIGFAGAVESVDTTVLERLIETNIIPVVSPVALGTDGELYNVNADEAASHLAMALKAEKLFILTNVRGIMREKDNLDTLYGSLSLADAEVLVKKNIIVEGMIPKTRACINALEGKVKKAHIIDSNLPHALLLEIFTDRGIGTEIIKLGRRTKITEGL
ncbi:MAG: acetylglutamate kinase [Candidatus Omnitrophota bacterium]|nr:MAG: acetylglutamate kinase [Candidatus Omnitrophota bacterium]